MRIAALVISLIALTASQPSVAAIYNFTVELPPVALGPGGPFAPMERLTFALDTTQATTNGPIFPQSSAIFPSVSVAVFNYNPKFTVIVDDYVGAGSESLNLTDPMRHEMAFALQTNPIQLSNGIGADITFTTGSLPATNILTGQTGTMTITLAAATSVPEAPSWTILCAALGMLFESRRRRWQPA